ncbi:MAG: glycosyltransferase family 4 protein [Patescibacteria group bacterium]
MRIAFIGCKGIPAATSQGGGIEDHVERLATRLAQKGHHVTVYVRPYANPDNRKFWKGVHLITLPSFHRKNLDAISHTFLSSLHVLFRKADIVHYHGVGPATLSWIPRIFKPFSKVVVTFHSRDQFHGKWGKFAKIYLRFGEWASVNFPHATIAVSHVIQVFCKNKFKKHVWHIPNGVDVPGLNIGSEEIKRFGLKPDGYYYTLSRLVPHKAIDNIIDAYAGVKSDRKLVIIGGAAYDDVIYEKKLKQMSAHDPRIIFLGHQSGKTLQQLLGNGYAMIHASRSEGLSVGVLEAMSYGKLVVMSDIPENLELIDHSGVSFKVGDVKALKEILTDIDEDPEMVKDRGMRGREMVKIKYSWDTILLKTESLYWSLLKPDKYESFSKS